MEIDPKVQAGRRRLLGAALALGPASLVQAQSFSFTPQQRYPDPSVRILDPEFTKYRIYSSSVEQLHVGAHEHARNITEHRGDGLFPFRLVTLLLRGIVAAGVSGRIFALVGRVGVHVDDGDGFTSQP